MSLSSWWGEGEYVYNPGLSSKPRAGSVVLQAENLSALRALRADLEGKVRCAYIDPPYNNQEVYRHYEDNHTHDEWLKDVITRLRAIEPLLASDGSIWISIDDRAMHYLKVAADSVFGRENFVTTIIWQQRTTRENRKVFSSNHEYLLVYAKDARVFKRSRNQLPPTKELLSRYKNPDNDPRGPWQSVSANAQAGHATSAQFYRVTAPNGKKHQAPKGRCWVYSKDRMAAEIAAGNIWFGKTGNGVPRVKRFLRGRKLGLTPHTLWTADQVGTNSEAKKNLLRLFPGQEVFDTPKPERLISRIIHIATNPGDIVLDPYLGSGTTVAVAHKMGRHCLGIERGDHAVTYCARRMQLVVAGDAGGVSADYGWQGGGDFSFYSCGELSKGRVRASEEPSRNAR